MPIMRSDFGYRVCNDGEKLYWRILDASGIQLKSIRARAEPIISMIHHDEDAWQQFANATKAREKLIVSMNQHENNVWQQTETFTDAAAPRAWALLSVSITFQDDNT